MIQTKLKIEGNISLKKWKEILRIKRCCKPKNMSIIIIYFKTFVFFGLKKQHPVTANTQKTHLPLFSKTSRVPVSLY